MYIHKKIPNFTCTMELMLYIHSCTHLRTIIHRYTCLQACILYTIMDITTGISFQLYIACLVFVYVFACICIGKCTSLSIRLYYSFTHSSANNLWLQHRTMHIFLHKTSYCNLTIWKICPDTCHMHSSKNASCPWRQYRSMLNILHTWLGL